ncbi:hypothetical protein ACTA71_009671 [Dictyostelium dimigraforme]
MISLYDHHNHINNVLEKLKENQVFLTNDNAKSFQIRSLSGEVNFYKKFIIISLDKISDLISKLDIPEAKKIQIKSSYGKAKDHTKSLLIQGICHCRMQSNKSKQLIFWASINSKLKVRNMTSK